MPKNPAAAQRAKERKEKKQQELMMKQSKEKCDEGRVFLEPEGKAQPVYNKAVACFDQAIELYPENAEAFTLRGTAYLDQKMPREAIEDFSKAFSLNAQSVQALEGRAACYELLKQWDKCIADYSVVLEVMPENDHAHNMRGLARLSKRAPGLRLKNADYAAVVEDFKAAVKLNENNYYAHANLGKAYMDHQKFEQAIEEFTKALVLKDDYVYALYRRGTCALMWAEHVMAKRVEEEHEEMLAAAADAVAAGGGAATAQKSSSQSQSQQQGAGGADDDDEAFVAKVLHREATDEKLQRLKKKVLSQAVQDFSRLIPDEKDQELTTVAHRGTAYLYMGDFDRATEDLQFASKAVEQRIKDHEAAVAAALAEGGPDAGANAKPLDVDLVTLQDVLATKLKEVEAGKVAARSNKN